MRKKGGLCERSFFYFVNYFMFIVNFLLTNISYSVMMMMSQINHTEVLL